MNDRVNGIFEWTVQFGRSVVKAKVWAKRPRYRIGASRYDSPSLKIFLNMGAGKLSFFSKRNKAWQLLPNRLADS